jgi:hypothetical protein
MEVVTVNREKQLAILGLPPDASPEAVAEKAHDLRYALGLEPLEYAEAVRLTEEGRVIGRSTPITLPYGPTLRLKPYQQVKIPMDELATLIESAKHGASDERYEELLDAKANFGDMAEGKDADEVAALSGQYPEAYDRWRRGKSER